MLGRSERAEIAVAPATTCRMGKGRGKSTSTAKQPAITNMAKPLIKVSKVIGEQVAVPGSFWEGAVSGREKETAYMCTIREYSAAHKWGVAANARVTQAFELQEMGPEGRGSLEAGDASGEIFHMIYPEPFLTYYYKTFPEKMATPAGVEPAAPLAGTDEVKDEDELPGDVLPEFPYVRLGKAPVFKHFTVASDTLIEHGKNSGKYRCKLQCCIKKIDGSVCGVEKEIMHAAKKSFSTTNFIRHLRDEAAAGCAAHAAALESVEAFNPKVFVIDGQLTKKYNFSEAFSHHVDLLWLRASGLSGGMIAREEFQTYVRGYDPKAVFPDHRTVHRIAEAVAVLQKEERIARIRALKLKYKAKPCIGLQLDMWTDTENHVSYACVCMTSIEEPTSVMDQLYLRSEVLDFNVFPFSAKTGALIKDWFLGVCKKYGIEPSMSSGVTPDGAADGQCGLAQCEVFNETVDTCLLHQLQRAVLYALGLAGSVSNNEDAKAVLKKHNRVVMLSRQSLGVNKGIKDAQSTALVPNSI